MIYVRRVDILDYCSLKTSTCQLIVDLNKNILAPFITSLVRHPGKNLMTKQQCTVPRILENFLGYPAFLIFDSPRSRTWGQKNSKSPLKEYCLTREE